MLSKRSLNSEVDKKLVAVLILILLFSAIGFSSYTVLARDSDSGSVMQKLKNIDKGVVETGRLVYVNDGKELGNETYEIRKGNEGSLVLNSEGVVTPPIPIPFIKPKINFNQNIYLTKELEPVSLSLQYKGPLGIGSKKISASVNGDTLEIKRGKEERTLELKDDQFFFSGTTSSGALFAIVLAREGAIPGLTEIKSGGTGPQSGAEDQVLAEVVFQEKKEKSLQLNGKETTVTSYKYIEKGTNRERELMIKDGSLVVYRAKAGESTFYAFREDLLGEGFRF